MSAPSAHADRLEAYTGSGFCQFDNWLDVERNLAGGTYYFGTTTRCFGGLPIVHTYANAYLSADHGLGWSLVKRANAWCPAGIDCVASGSWSNPLDVRAKNEGDGTVELYAGGTQKNPNSVRFTDVSDRSRCSIYNGGYAVWCKGLLTTYR